MVYCPVRTSSSLARMEANPKNYELRAPDGGWGYAIVGATVVIFSVTVIPLAAFGLIYGEFLRSIGDETTGTTLSNGVFTTTYSFTGLLANALLNRFSYRIVGFIGAVTFIIGAVGLIFVQTLFQLIISFGVIQGVGFGLLMPASLSAFNAFFDNKMAVMMSVCQTTMIAFNMVVPQVAAWSMAYFGFRGTLIGLATLGLLTVPAVATLQPVTSYLKKVPITPEKEEVLMPLHHLGASKLSLQVAARPRKSVVSLGDRMASITTINELPPDDLKQTGGQSFLKSMDLSLLKDLKYLNISVGLALAFTGDMAFISIIPLMLGNLGYQTHDIATMMGLFFASDLVARILLTIVSGLVKFKSRLLILFTSALIVLARTALVSNDTYLWKAVFLVVLGFLRCFIQTPISLVFSQEYQDRFATAYSLFMAVNGVVSLVYGPLMSFVKAYTHSDVMVCHVLTLGYMICVVAWTCELTCCNRRKKRGVAARNYT